MGDRAGTEPHEASTQQNGAESKAEVDDAHAIARSEQLGHGESGDEAPAKLLAGSELNQFFNTFVSIV